MKNVISACLWFWAVLFSFGGDIARYVHWEKLGIGMGGVSVILFAILVWFHFKGYKRVKDETGA